MSPKGRIAKTAVHFFSSLDSEQTSEVTRSSEFFQLDTSCYFVIFWFSWSRWGLPNKNKSVLFFWGLNLDFFFEDLVSTLSTKSDCFSSWIDRSFSFSHKPTAISHGRQFHFSICCVGKRKKIKYVQVVVWKLMSFGTEGFSKGNIIVFIVRRCILVPGCMFTETPSHFCQEKSNN